MNFNWSIDNNMPSPSPSFDRLEEVINLKKYVVQARSCCVPWFQTTGKVGTNWLVTAFYWSLFNSSMIGRAEAHGVTRRALPAALLVVLSVSVSTVRFSPWSEFLVIAIVLGRRVIRHLCTVKCCRWDLLFKTTTNILVGNIICK